MAASFVPGFRHMDRCVFALCGLKYRQRLSSGVLCLRQKFKRKLRHTYQSRISHLKELGCFCICMRLRRGLLLVKKTELFLSCVLYMCDNLASLRARAISGTCD